METEDNVDVDVEINPCDPAVSNIERPHRQSTPASSTVTTHSQSAVKAFTKKETVKPFNPAVSECKIGTSGHVVRSPNHPAGSPSHHIGSPGHHVGSPIHNIGSPIQHVGSPSHHLGSPSHNIGSPIQHVGSPSQHVGSPSHNIGSPIHHIGSPIHHIGSPSHTTGSPSRTTGSTSGTIGSPIQHIGSPNQQRGSPVHQVASPIHRIGSPAGHLTGPGHRTGSPGSPIMVSTPTKQHQKVYQPNKKRPVVVLRDFVNTGNSAKLQRHFKLLNNNMRGSQWICRVTTYVVLNRFYWTISVNMHTILWYLKPSGYPLATAKLAFLQEIWIWIFCVQPKLMASMIFGKRSGS